MIAQDYKNRNRSNYSFANINFLGPCNLDCFFCLGKDLPDIEDNDLSIRTENLPNLDRFLEVCREKGVDNLYLTGLNTDPLIYQDLPRLIDYLQEEKGFKVGIRTNSIVAAEMIYVINMLNGEVGHTMLSLNADTVETITGRREIPDWNYIIPNITGQQRISSVLSTFNEDEMIDLIKYSAEFPQVAYFQVRKIATDTRAEKMQEHWRAFEKFAEYVDANFPKIKEFEKASCYDIFGLETCLWQTVATTVNSLNYFSNGIITKNYFVIEGLMNER